MNIKVFIIILVLCVLVIDAIRYRIIYFKFKSFGVIDFKEIIEHLNSTKSRAVPIRVGSEEEAYNKMALLSETLTKLSELSDKDLKLLLNDLDFLKFHYNTFNEGLADTVDKEIQKILNMGDEDNER